MGNLRKTEKKQKKRKSKRKSSKSPKKSPKNKNRARHRRKRRKKNDGDSSDENESEEEFEENESESEEEEAMDVDDEGESDEDLVAGMSRRLAHIDFSQFEEKEKERMDADSDDDAEGEGEGEVATFEQQKKAYVLRLSALSESVTAMRPNMKALIQYKKIQSKWKKGHSEHKSMRREVSEVNARVEKVRDERSEKLMRCFEVVQRNIRRIYGELTASRNYKMGGKAFLNMGGAMNAFDDEMVFNTMPPGKPFRKMQSLSGGEKSLASLALLFAIHSFKPSPFFILDEIDAALDARNVQRVCRYIQSHSSDTQIIVISLKDKFYSNADSLIGVCKDAKRDASCVLSLELAQRCSPNANANEA